MLPYFRIIGIVVYRVRPAVLPTKLIAANTLLQTRRIREINFDVCRICVGLRTMIGNRAVGRTLKSYIHRRHSHACIYIKKTKCSGQFLHFVNFIRHFILISIDLWEQWKIPKLKFTVSKAHERGSRWTLIDIYSFNLSVLRPCSRNGSTRSNISIDRCKFQRLAI